MDNTTAFKIIAEKCKAAGVPFRVAGPDDPIYSEGPSIQFMNQSGKPTEPIVRKRATGKAVYKPDLPKR